MAPPRAGRRAPRAWSGIVTDLPHCRASSTRNARGISDRGLLSPVARSVSWPTMRRYAPRAMMHSRLRQMLTSARPLLGGDRAARLDARGARLARAYERSGDVAHLDAAVAAAGDAVAYTPEDSPRARDGCMTSQASPSAPLRGAPRRRTCSAPSIFSRTRSRRRRPDLPTSLSGSPASASPFGHVSWRSAIRITSSVRWSHRGGRSTGRHRVTRRERASSSNLAVDHWTRYVAAGSRDDLETAVTAYEQAVEQTPLRHRLRGLRGSPTSHRRSHIATSAAAIGAT